MPNCSSPPPWSMTWDIGPFAIRSKISASLVWPQHELFANSFLLEGEIADTLREVGYQSRRRRDAAPPKSRGRPNNGFWPACSRGQSTSTTRHLHRDSLHAGVPYGRHFDQGRLIGSLCLNEAGDGLAITDKGRTAAEMLVFAATSCSARSTGITGFVPRRLCCKGLSFCCNGSLDLDAPLPHDRRAT